MEAGTGDGRRQELREVDREVMKGSEREGWRR